MRADVALYGTQKTLPLGSKTPPMYAELPGYVPVGCGVCIFPAPVPKTDRASAFILVMFRLNDGQNSLICLLTGAQGLKS